MNHLSTNEGLGCRVIEAALERGVREFCLCPGARNAPLIALLASHSQLIKHYWFEERSAAFFALGRSRATDKPVAVVTTSGTAAAELLPACMEAYYTGVPLLLITADRPRRFRGTGAPQTAEQVGLFGRYVRYEEDLALNENSSLTFWGCQGPAHLNVCFEEPLQINKEIQQVPVLPPYQPILAVYPNARPESLNNFLTEANYPLVVVGSLHANDRDPVIEFLLKIDLPVYFEAISGLRQNHRLAHLRIQRSDSLWEAAAMADYPIDGILRIGGIPTFRLWRDLEDLKGKVKVCSLSALPFTGLSWGPLIYTALPPFLAQFKHPNVAGQGRAQRWLAQDRRYGEKLADLLAAEPESEAGLVYALSLKIPPASLVYLGNSQPIREWDLASTFQPRDYDLHASRGLNGIDGQISTFFGLCQAEGENWALIGDLTALYDMAGPWILEQMGNISVNLVIINNGGGQIFARLFKEREFLHEHGLKFSPLAAMWKMEYHLWQRVPSILPPAKQPARRLIEIEPDPAATQRFWQKYRSL